MTQASPRPGLSGRGGAYSGHEVKLHVCFFFHIFCPDGGKPGSDSLCAPHPGGAGGERLDGRPQRHRRGGGHRGPVLPKGGGPGGGVQFSGGAVRHSGVPIGGGDHLFHRRLRRWAQGGLPGPVRRNGSGGPVGGGGLVVGNPHQREPRPGGGTVRGGVGPGGEPWLHPLAAVGCGAAGAGPVCGRRALGGAADGAADPALAPVLLSHFLP